MDDRIKNQAEIILRWRNLYHLVPIYSNVYDIPERVNAYNPNFFIVFNRLTQKYEVHSIAGGPNVCSRECEVPDSELDVRLLYFLWEQDIRIHGWDIFRRIEASEERARVRKKKQFSNWLQSVARETRTMFARDSWGGGHVQFPSAAIKEKEVRSL